MRSVRSRLVGLFRSARRAESAESTRLADEALRTLSRRIEELDNTVQRLEERLETERPHDPPQDNTPTAEERRNQFYRRPGYPVRSLVFGLGTGRSGTVSLARLLDAQNDASIGHEMRPLLPWNFDRARADHRLWQLEHRSERVVGDVAYYYLPYVAHIASRVPDARFVCLRRSREEVVRSMMDKTPRTNLWVDHDGDEWDIDPIWDATMPTYAPMPKAEAIGKYWDDYYVTAERLEHSLVGRFRIFEMEASLNTEEGVRALLDFIGIPLSEQVIRAGIVENRTVDPRPGG